MSVTDATIGSSIKLVALQTIHYRKVTQFSTIRIKTAQTLISTYPQASITILQNPINNITRQTVICCILQRLFISFS